MDRLSLKAQERTILGKKVKSLRVVGLVPGHVFGNKVPTEHVSVGEKEFLNVYHQAGETGLVDLKIGSEKVRPVLVRDVQYDPVRGKPLHIDFYQVNLAQKVTVPAPIVLVGEEPEAVKTGEAVVLQTLNEVNVEALPTDLVEKIEVDITGLQKIDDAITVGQLRYDHSKLTVLADEGEVVVKLAPAVTEEMQQLLEEQEAEAQAAAEEGAVAAGGEAEGAAPAEGEEGAPAGAEAMAGKEGESEQSEEGKEPA